MLDEEKKVRSVWPGVLGGKYQPLSQHDMERIHHTALDVLEQIGLSNPIPSMIEIVTEAGGFMSENDRLCFPHSLVEDILAKAPRSFVLPGQKEKYDLKIGGNRVHCGTGGAAVQMLDIDTGKYRETTLVDVYDIARLVDTLDNIHFYLRSVVARDIKSELDIDINTAYACMQGTTKHIGASFAGATNVRTAIEMFDMCLGSEGAFRKKPFCSIACCHVIPPLRFNQDGCDALEAAIRGGMPGIILSAAQAGATSPTALAGTIVQVVAEVLAGLIFCILIDPNCRVNLGTWPFVTDLRSGAMTGGSGESALLASGCAQMAGFYGLPGSVAAGMTDSKLPDSQSGSEKAYNLALAANAGSTLIFEAAGMQASLMGVALESFVIDNEALGAIQRTVRGIEVNEETLSYEVIHDVAFGEGSFLSHDQTLDRMETDYFYPEIGDRNNLTTWEAMGATDMRERAKARAREILKEHYPSHIDPATDEKIRRNFNILLPSEAMTKGNSRW